MPRDDWAKARAADAARRRRKPLRQPRKVKIPKAKPQEIANHFSLNSVLWFGRFNGRAIRDVPRWYLERLAASTMRTRSRPYAGLRLYLQRLLQSPAALSRPRHSLSLADLDRLNTELSCGSQNGLQVQATVEAATP